MLNSYANTAIYELMTLLYFVECDSIESMKPSKGTFLCASTYHKEGTSCDLQCQDGMVPGNKKTITCKAERTAELQPLMLAHSVLSYCSLLCALNNCE